MFTLRSTHLFAAAMALAFVAAFVLPPRLTTPAQGEFTGLFSPAARPARALAGLVYRRFNHDPVTDDGSPAAPRPTAAVYAENHQLRGELMALQEKFAQLSRLNADRGAVGDILPLCRPATVTGADASGLREALTLSSASTAWLGRPVLHGTDLVGRVVRAGLTGCEVQLVSDPGFACTGRIGRYVPDASGQLRMVFMEHLQPLVQGIGHGAMAIRRSITMQQVADLKLGATDVVLLDDHDGWPANVQGLTIGRITSITAQPSAPLLADVRVEPAANLMRLNEVMVMVKD